LCLANQGYQGLAKQHPGACISTKKLRQQVLPAVEKQHDRALVRLREQAEHGIRRFKTFRIFSGRYRNRRKRFGLRLNLIASLLTTNWYTPTDSCMRSSVASGGTLQKYLDFPHSSVESLALGFNYVGI